nr:MAG TPA: dimeris T4 recombination endonuclease VII [Caudoviricetes sp.]
MEYKNKKTGRVINTPFVISGGDWIPYNQEPEIKQLEENNEIHQQEEVPQKNKVADEKTDNPALDDITKADIMQELDAFGVKYDKRANKQVLYDLMMEQGKE